VVLECVNCTLSSIAAMGAGWHKLVLDILVFHEFLQCGGALIVEALELWFQSDVA
jgi:hypothetical protein